MKQIIERYEAPGSLEEVLAILDKYGRRARLIAGGTDILLEIERGVRPDVSLLVDLRLQ